MRKLLFVALFASTSSVHADWAEVPLEVLVDEADLIVAGKVIRVQDGGFVTIGPRKFDHAVKQDMAVVEVSSVLKTSPQIGKPKVVHIGQPKTEKVTSADIRFRPEQQGIWLLTRDPGPQKVYAMKEGILMPFPERNIYWARHPGQFLAAKEQKKLEALVAARSKLEGGKAVDGLVARAELLERPGGFEVRFSLKNVSDKPIVVCDYVGHQPLKVQWTGPGDKPVNSKHYAWLRAADIAGMMKGDFVAIPPGGVRFTGPRGQGSGIIFLLPTEKAAGFHNVAEVGKHRVTVSFATKDDGKEFGLEKVWTGTVTANEVSFVVK
jgi:hypothetical protein